MRFGRMDLNLLVALEALIATRSVSSAAKQLSLTQPAMTAALNRLRDYFEDELLIQSGRQMLLTPRAQELEEPIREMLMLVASRIDTPPRFDPGEAEREFTILASDYMFDTILAGSIAELAKVAPKVTFDFRAIDRIDLDGLARGEIDLLITVEAFLFNEHPRSHFFDDQHAVIAWRQGKYGEALTEANFFEAGHVVPLLGVNRQPAFTENYLNNHCQRRRVEVRVPHFRSLPLCVMGTDRIATIYRRHANYFANIFPITVHPMPFEVPDIRLLMQWHKMRSPDAGLRWLREALSDYVSRTQR